MGSKAKFLEYATEKIVPIQGDLIVEDLGISPEDQERIINDVDIIINSAASVNFDDPLKDALNINYFGAQRLLLLAKKCKNLKIFTHVSTAYVNCNMKGGKIDEIIYGEYDDVENEVAKIMAMDIQYVKDNEKKIIGPFPNTYTFTKNLAEKYIKKN